ncbi:helix-turn-helix domain-containing protein [Micromonospora saelicesensis]|uniref:helix-turn-helix domain-containing protein n=1 Tax=Micromonospora saelicesensis TaxID=285676 RepID=UPI000DDB1C6C|nr:helix-turn-helix transcriptional regulator [Micromonospora saelicesensis]
MIEPPPPVDLAALGHAVAKARQAANLTLDGLAERSGVSRRMLVEVEQGRINCTIGVLHGIAHAVDVPLGALAQAACTDTRTK